MDVEHWLEQRLSQKALKRKIHPVFSHTLFENGRRRTGRSGEKAAEGEESCWDLESTGMFNSIQLSPQLLYYHKKLFFPPSQHVSCSHTSRRSFQLWGVWGTTSTKHTGREELHNGDRHSSSQPDHRLAMLGSTHQPSTSFNFFTLCYLHSFHTKFSDHYLPTHFHTSSILQRHSDKVTSTQPLTVTHQNQRQTWHWCSPLALGSLGGAKLSLQGSASQNSSERLKGFSNMTKRGVTAVTPDTRESDYHVVNHPAWQLGSGISWFSAQTHSWSHWWPHSSS